MALAKASMVASSAQPGWSRSNTLRMNARSIGRRFFDWNSGSFFLRSARVGLPLPVQTNESSARRDTRSGCRCAKSAPFSAPDEMPYTSSFFAPVASRMYRVPALRSSAPFAISQLIGRCLSERP